MEATNLSSSLPPAINHEISKSEIDNETPPSLAKRIAEIFARLLNSNILRTFLLAACIAGGVTIIALSTAIPVIIIAAVITGVALFALGLHLGVNFKKLGYEISLFATLVLKTLRPKAYAWWHLIVPHLYLGALPLKNFSHDQQITSDLGIKAVLSVVEDFEFNTKGIFTVPCRPKDWEKLNVKHLVLQTQDLCPPSLETLEKGVQYLEDHIDKGDACYVHCKAGSRRSAIMVMAYLLKKKRVNSVDDGEAFLKKIRPIVSITDSEIDILKLFEQKLNP
jgi:atypical dual specificity phosphatase